MLGFALILLLKWKAIIMANNKAHIARCTNTAAQLS